MTQNQQKFQKLLTPLFKIYKEEIKPASKNQIEDFEKQISNRGIPDSVAKQLIEFYEVTNRVPCLNGFDFHACDDAILFEWWDKKELWLGSKDDDILRWSNDKFCLGDASNVSYSKELEFNSLIELIEGCKKEWVNVF